MSEQRQCPSCGEQLPPRAAFCPACGTPAPTQLGGSAPSEAAEEQQFRARLQRALGPDYVLRERLGQGGFGVVYAAWERTLEREVAVKALRYDLFPTEQLRERFRREARVVAKLRHPNIVPIYAVGEGAPLHDVRPDVPQDAEAAIMQCLAKDPDARWATATELAETLRRCACL